MMVWLKSICLEGMEVMHLKSLFSFIPNAPTQPTSTLTKVGISPSSPKKSTRFLKKLCSKICNIICQGRKIILEHLSKFCDYIKKS